MPVKTNIHRSQSPRRKGITKIELLCSILVLTMLVLFLRATASTSGRVSAQRAACLENLATISKALQAYLADNDHRWPAVAKLASIKTDSAKWPTLPEVLDRYVKDRNSYHCPADQRTLSDDSPLRSKFSAKTSYFATEGTSYEWWFGEAYAGKKVGEESLGKSGGFGMGKADQPLLSDFEPFHTGDELGAINTLNADFKQRTSRARASSAR